MSRGMCMSKLLWLPALAIGLCMGEPAFAASLEAVSGEVSINRGEGFQRVTGPTEVGAGALLMASPGGSAKLVYADGCPVRVIPGTVVRVAAKSPCKAQYYAGLEEPVAGGLGLWPFFVGAGAVAIIACVAELCDDDGRRGRSP
jgi:hypothetical protein